MRLGLTDLPVARGPVDSLLEPPELLVRPDVREELARSLLPFLLSHPCQLPNTTQYWDAFHYLAL